MESRQQPTRIPTTYLGQVFHFLENKGFSWPFLSCSLAAGAKCVASVISQPLKQIQQIKSMPENAALGFLPIAKKHFRENHSFLTGATLNAEKAGLREYTRFFLLTDANKQLESCLPSSWQSSNAIKQAMNGTIIAASDVVLYSPFDRLSNIQVTHQERTGRRLSMIEAYHHIPEGQSLWRGSMLNMLKLSYGWMSFLSQHEMAVNALHNAGIHSSAAIAGSDALIAVVNAPVMNAFDVMYNKVSNDKPLATAHPLKVAAHILKTEGPATFLRGTTQRGLLSIFTVVGRGWTLQRLKALDKERAERHRPSC